MDLPAQWTGEGTSLALSPGQDPAWKKTEMLPLQTITKTVYH